MRQRQQRQQRQRQRQRRAQIGIIVPGSAPMRCMEPGPTTACTAARTAPLSAPAPAPKLEDSAAAAEEYPTETKFFFPSNLAAPFHDSFHFSCTSYPLQSTLVSLRSGLLPRSFASHDGCLRSASQKYRVSQPTHSIVLFRIGNTRNESCTP